ncbi:MAG: thioredoxin domain-containing protein [Nitrospirae bacterium]|nr:thioredoxin domain-containing protein [Nitrospirota bacterium]
MIHAAYKPSLIALMTVAALLSGCNRKPDAVGGETAGGSPGQTPKVSSRPAPPTPTAGRGGLTSAKSGVIPDGWNRLALEKSPYLLQHAMNPVDWYPWGDEAFAKAKKEDKPIFLSIGYSTCYWCHVMEETCFSNPEIAGIMNQRFVSIKVDREERPDVDNIYMAAVVGMTGSGGWPLSTFITPDGKPFHGGTYFPPEQFKQVLLGVAQAWKDKRTEIEKQGSRVSQFIQQSMSYEPKQRKASRKVVEGAVSAFASGYDSTYGGFGNRPKFPRGMIHSFLLRQYRHTGDKDTLNMALHTLDQMARGGMYDQVGGGFHRYSTVRDWLVPHFEKMLYDNAVLARVYLEAYQVTRREDFARIAREILDYVIRDMTHPEGGFYSAQDAGEVGKEGEYYVWSRRELVELVGTKQGEWVARYFGATDSGNFEGGRNVLSVPESRDKVAGDLNISAQRLQEAIDRGRATLLEARYRRTPPHKDDKVLSAWNGLMISSMAFGYQVLQDEKYLNAARKAAEFVSRKLVVDGRLMRSYRDGRAEPRGFLEDYAFMVMALLDLYESCFDKQWLHQALAWNEATLDLFWDKRGGGFFDTPKDHEVLIVRGKDLEDNALPAGNSVALQNLVRLADLASKDELGGKVEKALGSYLDQVERAPTAFPQLLIAIDQYLSPKQEIVIVGDRSNDETKRMLRYVYDRFLPYRSVIQVEPDEVERLGKTLPMVAGKTGSEGKAVAYVCENYVCRFPTTDPDKMAELLDGKKKND